MRNINLYKKINHKAGLKLIFMPLTIFLIFSLVHCPKKGIPQQELTEAMLQISLSREEGAPKDLVAKDKYQQAKQGLLDAHTFIEKKSYDKAKTNALLAIDQAMGAREIVLPGLLNRSLDRSRKAMKLFTQSAAGKASPEELEMTKQLFEDAQSFREQGENLQAQVGEAKESEKIILRRKALGLLHNAYLAYGKIEQITAQSNQLENSLGVEIANLLKTAKASLSLAQQRGASAEQLKKAQSGIQSAQSSYNEKQYAEARESLASVTEYLAALIEKLNVAFSKNILTKANSILAQAKADAKLAENERIAGEKTRLSNMLKNEFKEELAASAEAITEATNLLEQKNYEESIKESEDSLRLSRVVSEQISVEMLREAKASVAAVSNSTTTSKKMEQEIASARTAHRNAKEALSKKEYTNSIQESGKAIRFSQSATGAVATRGITQKVNKASVPSSSIQVTDIGGGWKRCIVRDRIPADCLWCIAAHPKIYGKGHLWERIYESNKAKIKKADLIHPGQVLLIPPPKGPLTRPTGNSGS